MLIDGMPELPDSWRYVLIDWLAEPGTVITYGIVLPGPEVAEDGVPYVRQQDIQDGRIGTDELRHTTQEIAARHERSSLAEGDILLCIIRNLRVAVVPATLNGANITQGAVRIRPNTSYVAGAYLAAYLASETAQSWMRQRYFGMDMPRINVEDARAGPVALPPLQEQLEIARRLDALLRISDAVDQSLASAQAQVEALTPSVLAKAFRGELVPTEAELARQEGRDYEPAAALLERVRGERGAGAAHASGRHRRSTRNGVSWWGVAVAPMGRRAGRHDRADGREN